MPEPGSIGAFLCLRRGVSDIAWVDDSKVSFSLPTQRCFPRRKPAVAVGELFSAYAEVFLVLIDGCCASVSFSLPTQRCFPTVGVPALRRCLFSAYAEVFLNIPALPSLTLPFLCLRRGVSTVSKFGGDAGNFSLPTQRCIRNRLTRNRRPFLCLRRGVSGSSCLFCLTARFSLPTQRCFCVIHSGSASPPTFLCLRRGVSCRKQSITMAF